MVQKIAIFNPARQNRDPSAAIENLGCTPAYAAPVPSMRSGANRTPAVLNLLRADQALTRSDALLNVIPNGKKNAAAKIAIPSQEVADVTSTGQYCSS